MPERDSIAVVLAVSYYYEGVWEDLDEWRRRKFHAMADAVLPLIQSPNQTMTETEPIEEDECRAVIRDSIVEAQELARQGHPVGVLLRILARLPIDSESNDSQPTAGAS